MKTYNLTFDGSWGDDVRDQLPKYSGVYLVYRGVYERGSFTCREIIYIGQAENIRERHKNHEKRDLFLAKRRANEVIFYSCAPVATYDLDREENALVYEMRPILNDKLTESFPYPETIIESDGQCALLHKKITMDRKDK